ncbi:YhjD/YihY/BrkB family envelope integrity protein [Streptomyces yerevanensis]|uniref:YhjD/YihY/BrkB family envelope integrity protein n=1 Tax=Streptomyces yerevanensis TaxID=66378 RepID=UPI000998128C
MRRHGVASPGDGGPAEPRSHPRGLGPRWRELGRFLHTKWVRVWRRGREVELMHRAMGFAALGLVTIAPLLIVVAAAAPLQERGFALWVVDGMGLSGRPADAVQNVFSAPRKVLSTTSVLSVVLLALFGVPFAGSVQTGYEKVWDLAAGRWHTVWRRAVWLAALTVYLFAEAQSGAALGSGTLRSSIRIGLSGLFGVLFFWWGQRFLLGGRVPWRALLPGAIATMVGLGGLRVFSSLVFSPLIVTNAVSYGAVGTVLIVTSWLVGVGFVVLGGALIGRYWYIHEPHHIPHPHLPTRKS